jgi:hypothetical protein
LRILAVHIVYTVPSFSLQTLKIPYERRSTLQRPELLLGKAGLLQKTAWEKYSQASYQNATRNGISIYTDKLTILTVNAVIDAEGVQSDEIRTIAHTGPP